MSNGSRSNFHNHFFFINLIKSFDLGLVRDLQTSRSLLQKWSLWPRQAQTLEFQGERGIGWPITLPWAMGTPSAVHRWKSSCCVGCCSADLGCCGCCCWWWWWWWWRRGLASSSWLSFLLSSAIDDDNGLIRRTRMERNLGEKRCRWNLESYRVGLVFLCGVTLFLTENGM